MVTEFGSRERALFHFKDNAVYVEIHGPLLHGPHHFRSRIAESHEVHRLQSRAEADGESIRSRLADAGGGNGVFCFPRSQRR